jgi:hypothetical protein
MLRKSSVSKYLAKIGRKGGKASGKARMEKLTPEQRAAVARTAAAARWAKPVTQTELQRQAALQDAEWAADRVAQKGAEDIDARLSEGAPVNPGKLTFDKKRKRAILKKAESPSAPRAKKSKPKKRAVKNSKARR